MIEILQDGDERLRRVSADHQFGPATYLLVQRLSRGMRDHGGLGLSAPQIGINERVFVTAGRMFDGTEAPIVVINPLLNERSEETFSIREGCLSREGLTGVEVERPLRIEVSYYDRGYNLKSATLTGMAARVFLHEFEHLNGILISDYSTQDDA